MNGIVEWMKIGFVLLVVFMSTLKVEGARFRGLYSLFTIQTISSINITTIDPRNNQLKMNNQQDGNDINPPDGPPENQIIRQRHENRLAFAHGDPLPFPNIPYPLEDDDNILNIPPQPANLHPIPLGPITRQNLRTFPHAFNLLMH
ncbi:hypothetical protein BCON_0381g00010 [Botryotinia convoluta]|uniref:Uncharacterized protein n=1 Tax=Botryotinia convoluta TaxID=54673 RepID=A0A4Z1HBE3_9HELO|nr:hypothetical protein BCON_0381g00010 [Botryotinia convoluta]